MNSPRRSPLSFTPFFQRILHALLLRREAFAQIAEDRQALGQAAALVCLTAMAEPSVSAFTDELGTWGLLIVMVFAVVRWLVYSTVVYPVGRLFAAHGAPFRRVLRCIGFTEAPGLLRAVLLLGPPGPSPALIVIYVLIELWKLAATTVAVRAAFELNSARAVGAALIAFAIYEILGIVTRP